MLTPPIPAISTQKATTSSSSIICYPERATNYVKYGEVSRAKNENLAALTPNFSFLRVALVMGSRSSPRPFSCYHNGERLGASMLKVVVGLILLGASAITILALFDYEH